MNQDHTEKRDRKTSENVEHIDIDMTILENIVIDIDKAILENINIGIDNIIRRKLSNSEDDNCRKAFLDSNISWHDHQIQLASDHGSSSISSLLCQTLHGWSKYSIHPDSRPKTIMEATQFQNYCTLCQILHDWFK